MRKINRKSLISSLLFVVLIGLLAWYLYANRADLAQLLTLNASTVCWMLVLALGACMMNGLYHKLILDTYHLSALPFELLPDEEEEQGEAAEE